MPKLKNLLAGCVVCALASTGFAEDKSKVAAPSPQTLSIYRTALKQHDYDVAELLARGVLAKHGEENEFGQVMLTEIDAYKKAAEGPRLTSYYVLETKIYQLYPHENFGTIDPARFEADAKKLIEKTRQEIGPRWDLFNMSAAPFSTNWTVVASAPQFVHEVFAKNVAEMRSTRKEQVAN